MSNGTTPALGRLEKIELRDIWRTEAQDFTPWLAQPDNLAILADALKLDLELEAQERNVGPFRADILCKDTVDGSWVLIENQLERTDHIHLGQLLTYASGLHAVTVVWIAGRFTDEHREGLQTEIDGRGVLRSQKPQPQHWTNFAIGRSGFMTEAMLNSREKRIGVGLYIGHEDAKAFFHLLKQVKAEIERELGFPLEWLELPHRTSCRLLLYKNGADPLDEARWPEYRQWMADRLEVFDKVFRNRIRNLSADDYEPAAFEGPVD